MPIGYTQMTQPERAAWLISQFTQIFQKRNNTFRNAYKLLLLQHLPNLTPAGKDSRNKLKPLVESYLEALTNTDSTFFRNIEEVFA